MKTLLFFMSFLIILFIGGAANAVITCAMQYPATSGHSGFPIPDSRFSLFEHFHKTPHSGPSSFDFDVLAVFDKTKPTSDACGTENLDARILLADEGDNIVPDHFLNSGGYSEGHHLKGISWSPSHMMTGLHTGYAVNKNSSNPSLFIPTNGQSGIRDTGNDVIDIVPSPGAFILGGVGLGMIGWLRRNRML